MECFIPHDHCIKITLLNLSFTQMYLGILLCTKHQSFLLFYNVTAFDRSLLVDLVGVSLIDRVRDAGRYCALPTVSVG